MSFIKGELCPDHFNLMVADQKYFMWTKNISLPEVELAEPVLALSSELAEAEEVAEDTPELEPRPENMCE